MFCCHSRFQGLSRPIASALIQLRTGKIGLKKYLHSIGKRESPICNACPLGEAQDVAHVLIRCPALEEIREQMWTSIGRRVTDCRTLLNEPDSARHAALMAIKAGPILGETLQFRHVDAGKEGATSGLLDAAE